MTHARSLTYKHLIKLCDVNDAVQLLEQEKKERKYYLEIHLCQVQSGLKKKVLI